MSGYDVDIEKDHLPVDRTAPDKAFGPGKKGRAILTVVAVIVGLLILSVLVAAMAGLLYWRSLQNSPQYALAEVVDASRNGNEERVYQLIDVDSVVDSFVPQVMDKAMELYGRGVPPAVIRKARAVAAPILPVVKQRARAALPGLIRERTERFKSVPFWGLAVGADRYLDVDIKGDVATVKSDADGRPLELTMRRSQGKWRVVAVKDDQLAKNIASRIGEELIILARQAGEVKIEELGRRLGIDSAGDLMKAAEDLLK